MFKSKCVVFFFDSLPRLLLMGLCATVLKPYLKSAWIISSLPTWLITLSKWKIDGLIFIIHSRQVHIGCFLALYYPHGSLHVDSFFFFPPGSFWIMNFSLIFPGFLWSLFSHFKRQGTLFAILYYCGMSPVLHKFLKIITNYSEMAPAS